MLHEVWISQPILYQWWNRFFPPSFCLTHPLRERLTPSVLMLRMKGAPFKSLFVLCRVPNQWQRWDQKPAGCPAVNVLLMDAHLYAKQQLWEQHWGSFSSPKRKKQEPEHACEPRWSCMLLSTPQGLEMGTGPERQKHREGRMEDGGRRGENRPGIMRGLKKKGLFHIHHSGERSCLTVGWYRGETFFYLQQGQFETRLTGWSNESWHDMQHSSRQTPFGEEDCVFYRLLLSLSWWHIGQLLYLICSYFLSRLHHYQTANLMNLNGTVKIK